MLDNLFLNFVTYLQYFPSIFISLVNFIICVIFILIIYKKFGYSGLCGYMILSSVIANIQVLYATSYELINMEVLLGTVIFCSSFLACDIVNLKYGEIKAKHMLYLTMFTDIFFLINIILTLGHKPIDYAQYPEFSISKETIDNNIAAIKQIFLPVPRLLIASYISYFCSQLVEIKFLSFIRKTNTILKHNTILFVSNVFLDTFIFTFLGMCIFAAEPLNFQDFWEISCSAILIRIICNFLNSFCIKITLKENNK